MTESRYKKAVSIQLSLYTVDHISRPILPIPLSMLDYVSLTLQSSCSPPFLLRFLSVGPEKLNCFPSIISSHGAQRSKRPLKGRLQMCGIPDDKPESEPLFHALSRGPEPRAQSPERNVQCLSPVLTQGPERNVNA